jgi:hypothetical protein
VGGAGAALGDGEDVDVGTQPVSTESVGHRGVFAVTDEICGVREVSIGAVFPFPNLILSNGGVAAFVVRVSYESGFDEADEVRFVGGGWKRAGKMFVGEDSGARGERVRGHAFVRGNEVGEYVMSWQFDGVLIVMGRHRI